MRRWGRGKIFFRKLGVSEFGGLKSFANKENQIHEQVKNHLYSVWESSIGISDFQRNFVYFKSTKKLVSKNSRNFVSLIFLKLIIGKHRFLELRFRKFSVFSFFFFKF